MTVTSPLDAATERELDSSQAPLSGDADTATLTDTHDTRETPQSIWALSSSSGWLAGQRFAVTSKSGNGIVKIGRASHCDIIFPGTHLSREHVELRVEQNHLYVKDKGSVSGTYINDIRITEGIVRAGDNLRLDIYSFEVEGPQGDAFDVQTVFDQQRGATRAASLEVDTPELFETAFDATTESPTFEATSPETRQSSEPESAGSLIPLYVLTATLVAAVVSLAFYLFLT